MNKFKVGDIVELDEKHSDFEFASSISGLQGHLEITDISSQDGFLYFDCTRYNSDGGGWYPKRFKLVEAAKQPKPPKPISTIKDIMERDRLIESQQVAARRFKLNKMRYRYGR